MKNLLSLLLPPLLAAVTTAAAAATTGCPANLNIHNSPAAASTGIADFGFNLMRELTGRENILISPFSIWSVLSMVLVGAEGQTKTDLVRVLGLEDKTGALDLFRQLNDSLITATARDTNVSLNLANRIYIREGFSLRKCQDELSDLIVPLDFTQALQSSNTVNKFVNVTTRGLIQDIVQPSTFKPTTRMVVLNAVYFKGNWRNPFPKEDTIKLPFYVSPDAAPVPVDMMNHRDMPVKAGRSSHVKARVLQIPYSSGLFSMTILLPDEHGEAGFRATVDALTAASFSHALASLADTIIDVMMPKFEIKSTFADELGVALQTLGLTDLFTRSANLRSFADELFVSQMMHKTVVKVNEEGSEAAAVTVAVIDIRTKRIFSVNRPFLFFIHTNDTILFVGAYLKPE